MSIYAAISLVAFLLYVSIGIYTYNLDRKSRLNRIFLIWCISMSIWAFGYTFVYVVMDYGDLWQQYIWMKISAVGWCSFSAIILHLTMLFTGNKNIEKTGIKLILYTPFVVFLLTSVLFFRPDYKTPLFIENFFYTGDFLYNFLYLLACIYLMYDWGRKSQSIREKKQSRIICITSAIPFTFSLIADTLLPLAGIDFPGTLGHVYTLVMLFGVFYVIRRYRLFSISTESLVDEILTNMMDLFILLSPNGRIIRVSKSTEELLKFNEGEIIGKQIDYIIDNKIFLENIYSAKKNTHVIKYDKLKCTARDNSIIAISATCTFLIDRHLKDVLGIAIVGHDIMLMEELEREIEEHKKAERMLQENQERFIYLAYHDSLTGLPNRKCLYERLDIEIRKANRNNSRFAIFFLDLNGFKKVNDNYGHEMGDYLLCEAASRIKGCIRQTDEAARIGGDEFVLLVTDIQCFEDALIVTDKINNALKNPVRKGDIVISTSASIGISIFPEDGRDADTLINKADNMMYMIKNANI